MVINKHGSFYMRSGWGTKIIQAVDADEAIFSPQNEQTAVDDMGLGRVMIKALRYWSDALGLTEEGKSQGGSIVKKKTHLFELIDKYDRYFQRQGTLLLMHRNLATNKDNATAWYWAFNELTKNSFSKEEFVEDFFSYLAVNGMHIKKSAVDKEFNCFRNTYISSGKKTDKYSIMDEDTYPFLGPLHILKINDEKKVEKVPLTKAAIPLNILVYCIAMDNADESKNQKQISIDKLMEERLQVGKYFDLKYSKLIEMLMEAANRGLLSISNNFGDRFIEFFDMDYHGLIDTYFVDGDQ